MKKCTNLLLGFGWLGMPTALTASPTPDFIHSPWLVPLLEKAYLVDILKDFELCQLIAVLLAIPALVSALPPLARFIVAKKAEFTSLTPDSVSTHEDLTLGR